MALPDPNATNNLITEPFGSNAGGSYITLPIPVPSQIGTTVNKASFYDGFPPSTMTPEASGGLPFFGQDMNGLLYMATANIAALAAGALPVFNAARASAIGGYPQGALLRATSGENYWLCTVANNTTNPDASGTGWQAVASIGVATVSLSSGTVTLTNVQASSPVIVFTGTLTGNVTVNFPNNAGQEWIVAANTSGAYTISLQTAAAGNIVTLASGGFAQTQTVFSDGVNLYSTNVSTAGLAPLASPALTGTPTAPTAATGTNTTQIATTAYVRNTISSALSGYALLASPSFSGTPSAPTPPSSDNSARLATTAFVNAIANGTSRQNASGYTVLPNGLYIMWGSVNVPSAGVYVGFYAQCGSNFPNNCFVVLPGVVTSGSPPGVPYVAGTSKYGFDIYNTGGFTAITQSFIAIGN